MPLTKRLEPTLLFLPGTGCDERLWAAQIAALSPYWACIAVDYRDRSTISEMARIALGCTTEPVLPIGLSMGASVALEIWRLAPERVSALALFDFDPAADTSEKYAGRCAMLARMREDGMESVVRRELVPRYFAANVCASLDRNHSADAVTDAMEVAVDMALAHGVTAYTAQHAALSARQDYSALLAHIRVPTLIACGDDDSICPPALHMRTAAMISTARFAQIQGGGHLPSLAKPGETTAVLADWFDDWSPERRNDGHNAWHRAGHNDGHIHVHNDVHNAAHNG